MNVKKLLLIFAVLGWFAETKAAGVIADTIVVEVPVHDTLYVPATHELKKKKPHSPHRATIMAMILPSSGQIYNKQYWKLPILYGGIGAAVYGLDWNNTYYKKYRRAYVDYTLYMMELEQSPDLPYPENPSWDVVYKGGNAHSFSASQRDRFKRLLQNKQRRYKRDRDLLIIVMAGIYAIQIIDACVFAHFYDFEIDENLSFNLQPTLNPFCGGSVGLTLTINF